MKVVYSKQDLINMKQCFAESGGDFKEARRLYRTRYGMEPSTDIIAAAILEDGEESSLEDISTTMAIKEEVVDTEYEVPVPADRREHLKINLESIPIVYTTRLDDMLILNKAFQTLDVDDIVENIILESKPKFKNLPDQNVCPLKRVINPFFKLSENIRKFNELANIISFGNVNMPRVVYSNKRKAANNSRPVQGQIKDLRVVLDDCGIEPGLTAKVKARGNTYIVTELIPFKLPEHEYICVKTFNLRKGKYNSIIFIDNKTKTTDIYFINKMARTVGYCSLDHIIRNNEIPNNSIFMENCCWFGREINIKNITGWVACNNSKITADLMTTEHNCLPDNCNCCCVRPYSIYYRKPVAKHVSDTNQFDYSIVRSVDEKPMWLKTLLSKSSQEEEVGDIPKALNYTRPVYCNDNKPDTNDQKVKPAHIQITNSYNRMIDSYYLREKTGHVNKHIEVKCSDSLTFFSLHRPMLNQDSHVVCCWLKRDRLLSEMQSKYPQSAINSMRIRHNCDGMIVGEDCTCCCKTKNSTRTLPSLPDLNEINSSENLVHSKDYINKAYAFRKNICKNITKMTPKITMKKSVLTINANTKILPKALPSTPIEQQSSILGQLNELPSIQRKLTATRKTFPAATKRAQNSNSAASTSGLTPDAKKIRLLNTEEAALNKNPAEIAAERNQTPTLIQNQQNLTAVQNNVQPTSSGTLPTVNAENQDPTVNSLVRSILHRFSDVRLTITPDGDVSAELSTPIQQLSTAELKILSAILAHAKEQVKTLKANPGIMNSNSIINMFGGNPPTADKGLLNPAVASATNSNALPSASTSVPLTPPTISANKSLAINKPLANLQPLIATAINTKPGKANFYKPKVSVNNPYQCYTNITAKKVRQYVLSCSSYLNKKTVRTVPVINNVYSLNSTNTSKSQDSKQKRAAPRTYENPKKIKLEFDQNVQQQTVTATNTTNHVLLATPNGSLPLMAGSPLYAIIPKPITSLATSTLQDLVTSPFVPPPLVPPPLVPMSNNSRPAMNENTIIIIPPKHDDPTFSQVQIGPAFSLTNTTDVDTSELESGKTGEECILGF